MCIAIPDYCLISPNSSVSRFILPSSYNAAINDQVTLGCEDGYAAVGGSMVATCIAYNSTNGEWSGPLGNCSRKQINPHWRLL